MLVLLQLRIMLCEVCTTHMYIVLMYMVVMYTWYKRHTKHHIRCHHTHLHHPTHLQGKRDALVGERERLFTLLQEVAYLQPYPSKSNFILCKVCFFLVFLCCVCVLCEGDVHCTCIRTHMDVMHVNTYANIVHIQKHKPNWQVLDRDALGVKDALAQRGIMVRHYAKKDLSNYVRISVGLPEHTDAVVAALKDMA